MIRVFISIAVIFVLSCNNNPSTEQGNTDSAFPINPAQKEKDTMSVQPGAVSSSSTRCYWRIQQRDTFVLQLNESKGKVVGRLTFNNFQKDKSSGNVHGDIEADVIKLWYAFQSEGMHSVMQVYFKQENNQVIRGLGPVRVSRDTSYFQDTKEIKYENDQVWTQVNCSMLPAKYQYQGPAH